MSRSLHVLMTCCEYPPIGGGASHVVRGLANELAAMGHRIDLVTMGYRELPRFETIDGVNVHRVRSVRLRPSSSTPPELLTYLLSALPVVHRLADDMRHDVVHSHFIFPDGPLAASVRRRTGIPYVITAHGSDVPGYNPNRFRILHRLLAPSWRHVTGRASAVLSPSESLATLIRARHYSGPLQIVPNGYRCRGLATNRHVPSRLLVVSRLFERKGVQYVLEALEGFGWPLEVHVVGDGPFLGTLQQIAGRLQTKSTVHFHGWLDNGSDLVRELMETATMFALPSEAENFPNALLEAMDAGLAIITTSGTGCAEVVGPAAILVPPRDSPRIRDALERLCGDPGLCDTLGRAAHERVRGLFDWRSIAEQHVTIYESAIARAGRA